MAFNIKDQNMTGFFFHSTGCKGFGLLDNKFFKESGNFATSVNSERNPKFSPYFAMFGISPWKPKETALASRDKQQYIQFATSKKVAIEMVSKIETGFAFGKK